MDLHNLLVSGANWVFDALGWILTAIGWVLWWMLWGVCWLLCEILGFLLSLPGAFEVFMALALLLTALLMTPFFIGLIIRTLLLPIRTIGLSP